MPFTRRCAIWCAREAAAQDLRRKRQQLLSFLLRHGRIFDGRRHWTLAHRRWLAGQSFEHPAQQIVFQDAIEAIEEALARLRRLAQQLVAIVPSWSMAPVVEAYQAMRGASFLVAVTVAAEIGDLRRFDHPRQLMAFLGLVPRERSTGDTVRRAGLTLAGNRRARRVLVEAAWSYRHPARVSETLRARLEGLPKPVRDIAWKAQIRLCARYRRLSAAGKKLPVVIAAIAREMAAFLWAIARQVAPAARASDDRRRRPASDLGVCSRDRRPGQGRPCGPPLPRLKAWTGTAPSNKALRSDEATPRAARRPSAPRCTAPGMEPRKGNPRRSSCGRAPPDARSLDPRTAPRRRHGRRYPTRG
jgi:Transposase IS116/IS110/IS902 family